MQRKMALYCSKIVSALLRGIASKRNDDYYCLNYLHSFKTNSKLKSHKKVCKNKDFCNVMPSENTKILKFNQYHKSDNAPFIIFADLESLIVKIDGCKNNSEKSSATRVSEHILSG